jgi:hypothetical protein
MACDTQAVLNGANCLRCSVPPGMVGYVSLALMCAIRDGDSSMACDPAILLEEARCLQCAIPQGDLGFVQLAVLCDIASGGGSGGGGGEILIYTTTDPTTDGIVPANPNEPAIAYRDDGSLPIFVWNVSTHIWQ